jgi:quinol-cytochrome oxidoreductase complex cytochrome b subunit
VGVWGWNPTLSRFYSLHFLLPLVILWLVVVHTLLLHDRDHQHQINHFLELKKYRL